VKTLFILNDPPYGTERYYNALRLAHAFMKKDAEADVTMFLMADAVIGAKASLTDSEIMPGAKRSSMDALAAAVLDADKVLVF
jgi:uncharacterized protein involved in oxidation of intracellular sulfur